MVEVKRLLDFCDAEGIAVEYSMLGTEVAGVYIKHPELARPIIGLNADLLADTKLYRRTLESGIWSHLRNKDPLFATVYYRNVIRKSRSAIAT